MPLLEPVTDVWLLNLGTDAALLRAIVAAAMHRPYVIFAVDRGATAALASPLRFGLVDHQTTKAAKGVDTGTLLKRAS